MAFTSWWELGEGAGYSGNKMEVSRLECAFCGERGNFERVYHGEKKKPNAPKKLNFDVYVCGNCTGLVHVMWSTGESAFERGGLYDYKVLPWPLLGKLKPSDNWPEGVKRFWVQSHDSLKNENWDAANVMARSALQFVVREKGAKKGTLRDQIDDLVSKGVLQPVMQEWAHEVRELANESAHPHAPIPAEVTARDARDIVNFTDFLLYYLYDLPKTIEQYRSRKGAQG
jgi:Domain of unknown function (DUF4145)